MSQYDITLSRLRFRNNIEDSLFLKVYQRLLLGDITLTEDERFFLLRFAVYFIKSTDENVRLLGYRIILRYSNIFGDVKPLYDVALGMDYIPISKFLERKFPYLVTSSESFSGLFLEAYQENFKLAGDTTIYRSIGQMELHDFAALAENIAVIAPTSYGKSEMMIRKVQDNSNKNICIIVPSKALLAQTKKLLVNNHEIKSHYRKIITHPDMYRSGDSNILAVLTQERLLRLLQKNNTLFFDLVLVDEAHNILEDTERSHLLAQVLLILQKRNNSFLVNFFTPFLVNAASLNIKNHRISLKEKPIQEHMKIERYYACDLVNNKFHLYDQFLDKAFRLDFADQDNDINFVLNQKAPKNIVYLNRPQNVETFALEMASSNKNTILTPEIQKIVNSIGEFLHPQYNLINCIQHGILYHHGGIPDIVRLYVEDIFTKHPVFEFIITTSTLLEGVNIPAEKIFILNPKKGKGHLSASQFKNLIGRVCRFKEVFSDNNTDLKMLEPEIYLVKGKYSPSKFTPLGFYEKKVNSSKAIRDDIQNPLLENSKNKRDTNKVLEYLENIESGTSGLVDVKQPKTEIGHLCFINNIHDFDILNNEETLENNLKYYKDIGNTLINSAESLINSITKIFFENINLSSSSDNITRLKENEEARNFYAMFIGWRIQGAPYPLMINRFLTYWSKLENRGDDFIYVGSKWGDRTRGGGHQQLFVDITEKSEVQRVNLAIAKIKEEQEFIDFNILKYVEILNELKLIDPDFFDQVKYGTKDKYIICMLKNGFSMELSKLLKSTYYSYINFDLDQDIVEYGEDVINLMKTNKENDILIFEASCYI